MADAIAELARKAGVSEDQARKGLGAVLAVCKDKLPADVYSKMESAVPDADDAVQAAEAGQEGSGGGILGAVSGLAGKLFGGGGASALVAKLSGLGFSADQLKEFLPKVLAFFKERLPEDAMKKVSALLPTEEAATR
jgi:uncharacterized protein (DUF2267 family)